MSKHSSLETDAYLKVRQEIPSSLVMGNGSRNESPEETNFYLITNLEQETIKFEEAVSLMNNKLSHILFKLYLYLQWICSLVTRLIIVNSNHLGMRISSKKREPERLIRYRCKFTSKAEKGQDERRLLNLV